METIKFISAPLNANGTIDYNQDELKVKNGVYIIGIKTPINRPSQFDELGKNITEKIDRFLPLYVGKSENMAKRIKGHKDIDSKKGELNYNKELFDLDIRSNAGILYHSIKRLMDLRPKIGHTGGNKKPFKSVPKCKKCDNEIQMFQILKEENNSLVWFPNPAFFNVNIDSPSFNSIYNFHHAGHYTHKTSIEEDLLHTVTHNLSQKISTAKQIISDNFWFAYYILEPDSKVIEFIKNENPKLKNDKKIITKTLHCIEDNTFAALNEIGIHTYAKATNNKKHFIIDLSSIQNDLVNMTDAPFTSPLIL
jgi:hypothetical protein